MNNYLSRAQILLEQSRYDLAAQELHRQIVETPDNPHAFALLALCQSELKQFAEANANAARAVHMAPDYPFAHYVMGHVYVDQERYKEAEAAASEAVALDPEDADYLALRGSIYCHRRQWNLALTDANAGLSMDPDHIGCANVRAQALIHLGQRGEAGTTLQSALAKDPENATTHANRGWALLHENRHQEAMEHFREALRLQPDNAWARQGITEALKARNPVYRVMLRYFLWMSGLQGKVRGMVIIGGYIGFRVVNAIAKSSPAAAPYLTPLIVLYLVFAYLSWTARPLFNLLLRLDKFGRYALTRDEIVAANWFGASLLVALVGLIGFLLNPDSGFIFIALGFALLTIPIAATGSERPGTGRTIKIVYTSCLAACICAASILTAIDGHNAAVPFLLMLFMFGFVAFVWVANAAGLRER